MAGRRRAGDGGLIVFAIAAATAAGSGPSPMWYATRGAGVATLLLLTATIVLGIGTSIRWEGPRTPRFVTANLHRNFSLVALLLLAVHIVTTILDPYAAISVRDAAIPFIAAYRPFWLGLGILATQILIAIALTSALRGRIGPRAWRLIHWGAYASWPLAVVHGLGTGSDAQAPWMLGITASCVAAVLVVLARRLLTGRLATLPVRLIAGAVAVASTFAILVWAERGPLQPGWAAKAGTPTAQVATAPAATPGPVHTGTQGFSDNLIGTKASDGAGHTQFSLRDVVDPQLTLAIRPPTSAETLPVVTVFRDGKAFCTSPARVDTSLYAVCGTTRMTISLFEGASQVTGTLATSGSLG